MRSSAIDRRPATPASPSRSANADFPRPRSLRKPALITFLAATAVTLVCVCASLSVSRPQDSFDFLAGRPLIDEESNRLIEHLTRWKWVRRYYTFRASLQEAQKAIEPELTAKSYKQSEVWRDGKGKVEMVEYDLTSSPLYTNESYVRIYTHARAVTRAEQDRRQDGAWLDEAPGWVTLEVVFERKLTGLDKLLVKLESGLSR